MELKWNFLQNGSLYVEDPVYRKPYVLPPHIAGMFQTKEMQRLQDIKQTDYSWIDWPGLDDNKRWRHSMGVAHLAYEADELLMENYFKAYGIQVDKEEREIAECVTAAHDSGHLDNSHHSEKIIPYSHEKRTIDILLGDTEVGEYLRKRYPEDKIKNVVSTFAKIDAHEKIDYSTLSPFMQLWTQIISSCYDVDKLDYTKGDSYYAGIPSGVDPERTIDGYSAIVDQNGNIRLAIKEKAQRQVERLQIERFQNYRDVYKCVSSEIMDEMAHTIFELITQEPDEVKQKLPPIFLKKMEAGIAQKRTTTLEEELQMLDSVTEEAYETLSQEAHNLILRYLCDIKRAVKDFQVYRTDMNIEAFMKELQTIFPDRDFSNTKALVIKDSIIKLKKADEDFLIEKENGEVVTVEEQEGSVVKPQVFHFRRVFFNPELLRLELGLSKEEFEKYRIQLENFAENMKGKTEEFQNRYIVLDRALTKKDIIQLLKENGFSYIGSDDEKNIDDYYDTREYDLLQEGKELRGRRSINSRREKFSAMYKYPIASEGKDYTSRKISQVPGILNTSLEEARKAILGKTPEIEGLPLESKPIIHVDTNRTKMYFIRNGKAICVAWDETVYNNKWFGQKANDIMLEIQNREGTSKLILVTVGGILGNYPEKFKQTQMSKVLRGIRLTHTKPEQAIDGDKDVQVQNLLASKDAQEIEREIKFKFSSEQRNQMTALLPEILEQLGFEKADDKFKDVDQTDYYFDTPSLYYAKSKGKPSLRTREKKDGKLKATYKVPEGTGSNEIAERKQIEAIPQTIGASDFIKAMKESGVIIHPSNLQLTSKVLNHRKKLLFLGNGIDVELAIDDVTNINPNTNKIEKSSKDEIELEIKSSKISVEAQRKMLNKIWNAIFEVCSQKGIQLFSSEHNKYIDSLIELGILKAREQEQK